MMFDENDAPTDDVPSTIGRSRAITLEFISVIVWTIAADVLIFRGHGYFGLATFAMVAVALIAMVHRSRDEAFRFNRRHQIQSSVGGVDSRRRWLGRMTCVSAILLVLAIIRLTWSGHPLTVASAVVVMVSLALSLSGWLPNLSRVVVAAFAFPFFGYVRIHQYRDARFNTPENPSVSAWFSVLLPLAALIIFGGIFVMANPDWVSGVSQWVTQWSSWIADFLSKISFWEVPFCILAFFIGAGWLRPLVPVVGDTLIKLLGNAAPGFDTGLKPSGNSVRSPEDVPQKHDDRSPFYSAFRNTLVTLIALFTAYLVFEFSNLWRREFPPGFYYAGYAHQGAAWLTVALALATLTLSMIFNSSIQNDRRISHLKSYAWVWTALNVMLGIAVYNRLCIYVGYNGMTRMRMVGFFGVTLVLIGFILVIRKILKRRSFTWLIQVQLIALTVAVIVYSLSPIDYLVHRYNASVVASGYLKPSVMIAVKPIDDEGMFPLLDLIDVDNEVIRDGVRARLAERQLAIESYSRDEPWHWHKYQASKNLLYQRLDQEKKAWASYLTDSPSRESALERFKAYAMKWY